MTANESCIQTHKQLKTMPILMGQYKTCINFRHKPLFSKQRNDIYTMLTMLAYLSGYGLECGGMPEVSGRMWA